MDYSLRASARTGTSLRFRGFPCDCRLCLGFASRLPKAKAIFGQFHAENASINCGTTAFVHNRARCVASLATPWVAIRVAIRLFTREAALIRSAARHPLFAAAARLNRSSGTRHPLFRGGALGDARYPVSREGSILQRRVALR